MSGPTEPCTFHVETPHRSTLQQTACRQGCVCLRYRVTPKQFPFFPFSVSKKPSRVEKITVTKTRATMWRVTRNPFVDVILAASSGPYSQGKRFERTKFATRLSQQALHRPSTKEEKMRRRLLNVAFKMHECFQKNQPQIRTFLRSAGVVAPDCPELFVEREKIKGGLVAFAVLVINRGSVSISEDLFTAAEGSSGIYWFCRFDRVLFAEYKGA